MPGPTLLTFKQAAARINRSHNTIAAWCYDGLASQKVGSRRMVREDELMAFYVKKENVTRAQRGQPLLPPPGTSDTGQIDAQPSTEGEYEGPNRLDFDPLTSMLDSLAAKREYTALQDALKVAPAPCRDVPEFTAENPDVKQLRRFCQLCPVFDECGAYAKAAKIKAGFWAGVDRGKNPASTPQIQSSRAILADTA